MPCSTAGDISCLRKPEWMSEICTHTSDRHLCSCVGQRKEANERKCNIWCIWSAVNPACFHRGGSDRWGVLHENICGLRGHLLQPGLYMHNKCSKPGVWSCFTASLQSAAFTSKQAPSDKWQSSNIWPEWLKQREEASAVQEWCFFYIYASVLLFSLAFLSQNQEDGRKTAQTFRQAKMTGFRLHKNMFTR